MLSLNIKILFIFRSIKNINMAYYDSKESCWIQKIMAITFHIANDLPANTITKMGCKIPTCEK